MRHRSKLSFIVCNITRDKILSINISFKHCLRNYENCISFLIMRKIIIKNNWINRNKYFTHAYKIQRLHDAYVYILKVKLPKSFIASIIIIFYWWLNNCKVYLPTFRHVLTSSGIQYLQMINKSGKLTCTKRRESFGQLIQPWRCKLFYETLAIQLTELAVIINIYF